MNSWYSVSLLKFKVVVQFGSIKVGNKNNSIAWFFRKKDFADFFASIIVTAAGFYFYTRFERHRNNKLFQIKSL